MTKNHDFKGATPEKLAKALLRPIKRDGAAKVSQSDKRTSTKSEQPRVQFRISSKD